MMKMKYVLLGLLLWVGYLLYQAEEHFEHLVQVSTSEPVHQHYNERRTTHPDHLALNWMADLSDDLLISNVSVPGSHNTGTFACPKVCMINQCQAWNVKNQLQAGLRYLDFRVNEKEPLTIYHGPFRIAQIYPMLQHVGEFLRENPTEYLYLSFQLEFGKKDPHKFLLKELDRAGISPVFSKKIPRVGEMRGKAFIIAGVDVYFPDTYKIEGYYGMWDLPTAYIQNLFILFPWDVAFKKGIVMQTLQRQCDLHRFKINFWTGAFAVLPYLFAKLGKGPNKTNFDWLKANRGRKCIGISMIDYPSHALIKEIYMTNFDSTDF